MEVIRTTLLSSFNTCGYKFANDVYDPNPSKTYHWDMFNIWATSRGDYTPLLNYFVENINSDLKFKLNLETLMSKSRKFIDSLLDAKLDDGSDYKNQVFQEAKMYLKYDNDLWIEWVPDVYTLHQPDQEGIEIDNYDLKCSTWSWYTGDEMWDLNLQTYIYPLMLMNVYKKDRVRFSYFIWDKWNWRVKLESRIRTKEECEAKLNQVVSELRQSRLFGNFEAKKNKLCNFCELKWQCPLFNRQIEIVKVDPVNGLFE